MARRGEVWSRRHKPLCPRAHPATAADGLECCAQGTSAAGGAAAGLGYNFNVRRGMLNIIISIDDRFGSRKTNFVAILNHCINYIFY
mgnify:CR=1 FL=1